MATDNPRAVDDLTLSKSKKDPLNRVVFYFSAVLILIFSLVTFLFNDFANRVMNAVLQWVTSTFGWYYLLAAEPWAPNTAAERFYHWLQHEMAQTLLLL